MQAAHQIACNAPTHCTRKENKYRARLGADHWQYLHLRAPLTSSLNTLYFRTLTIGSSQESPPTAAPTDARLRLSYGPPTKHRRTSEDTFPWAQRRIPRTAGPVLRTQPRDRISHGGGSARLAGVAHGNDPAAPASEYETVVKHSSAALLPEQFG